MVGMTGKGTELWLPFPFRLLLSASGRGEIVVDCMAVADTPYGPRAGHNAAQGERISFRTPS